MLLPFNREQLKKRNTVDRDEELSGIAQCSPEQGIIATLELSEVVRELAAATGAGLDSSNDIEEKARLYVRPLKALRA